MLVISIAALAEERIIGSSKGKIPWKLPRDKAHFRACTAGRWLLVGRKTYSEMTGWFEDRTPIVLTSDREFRTNVSGHRVAHSLAEAIDLARGAGVSELMVCGGAHTYATALPMTDRLILTRIALKVDDENAPRFPEFETSGEWQLISAEEWPAEDGGPAARLEMYDRIRGSDKLI